MSPSFTLGNMSAIIGPIAPYSNVPIEPQFYQPRRFVISNISYGETTTVTTTEDMDYVIGQLIRLLIPFPYGAFQLNNIEAYVIGIPAADQVEIEVISTGFTPYIPSPFSISITGATQANPCVLTCTPTSQFITGRYVKITGIAGMIELNNFIFRIISSNFTSITIDVDASAYAAYTSGGTATLQNSITTLPEIIPIGDIGNGTINSNGRSNTGTYIPGAFINISPN